MRGGTEGTEDRDWQRLDKWLWCSRFMKARSDCTRLAQGGLLRINRQPTDKAHARLRVGDIITLPLRGSGGGRVGVIEVLALATRRGPPAEARQLYREIPEVDAAVQRDPCSAGETAAYRRTRSNFSTPDQ